MSEDKADSDLEHNAKLSEHQTFDPHASFPEGGKWGWLTLFGATLVQFCTFGYTNAFGVYQGWIGGCQIFMIFASGIFVGRLFDKGYFHHLMLAGLLLNTFCLFMLSLSKPNQFYQVFLSQGVGFGLSCGLTYLPSLTVVSHYFHKRRAMAMGLVAAGAAIGATVNPIILNKLFHGRIGFHNGVRISAGLNVGLLIIANLCMRTRLPPSKTGKAIPIFEFLRDPPYIPAVIGGLLIFCGLFFPVFFIQLNAISHGVDANFAFYSITILNGASILGRSLPAFFTRKFGVFVLMVFFSFGSGIILISMLAVKDLAGTVAFAVFIGFFTGGAVSLNAPMLALLAKDQSEIGVRMGVQFFLCGFIGLFASPIAGALLSSQLNWTGPILFAGICMMAGSCFYGISGYILAKKRGVKRL